MQRFTQHYIVLVDIRITLVISQHVTYSQAKKSGSGVHIALFLGTSSPLPVNKRDFPAGLLAETFKDSADKIE